MGGGGWRARGAGRGERTDGGGVGIFIVCRKANKVDEERARDVEKTLPITGALRCAGKAARKLLPAKYGEIRRENQREGERGGEYRG